MNGNKVTFTEEEEKKLSLLIDLVVDKYDLLLQEIKKQITTDLYININIFDLPETLIKTETKTFLIFLTSKKLNIIYTRGKEAAKKKISVTILLSIFEVIRRFLLNNFSSTKFINNILGIYIKIYLISFIKEQKELIYYDQGYLYESLAETVAKQREQLSAKELQIQQEKTTYYRNLYNEIAAIVEYLAHDVKLPLVIIENAIDMVEEEAENRKLPTLPVLKTEILEIKRFIMSILDIERARSGEPLYSHNKIVNISNMIRKKIELYKVITTKKNIDLTADIKDGLYILISPIALDRILNNLIDNGIKFNKPDGSIHINLTDKDNTIILTIRDTGIGIPKDDIKQIFLPYSRGTNREGNTQRSGLGIGLAFVKSILAEIGAKVTVKSKLNKHTTFTLQFKKKEVREKDRNKVDEDVYITKPRQGTVKLEPEIHNKLKKTLFIVEDDLSYLSFMQANLPEFNIYYAFNGRQAIEKIKMIPRPDFIISDIMMDEMDGFEFVKKFRQLRDFQNIPIIFLTAKISQEDKIKGYRAGVIDYVEKPFSIQVLKEKIHALIRYARTQAKLQREAMVNRMIKALSAEDVPDFSYELIYSRYKLSEREKEVVHYFLQGINNKGMAELMYISEETVKKHITNIKEKCGVTTKMQLFFCFVNPVSKKFKLFNPNK